MSDPFKARRHPTIPGLMLDWSPSAIRAFMKDRADYAIRYVFDWQPRNRALYLWAGTLFGECLEFGGDRGRILRHALGVMKKEYPEVLGMAGDLPTRATKVVTPPNIFAGLVTRLDKGGLEGEHQKRLEIPILEAEGEVFCLGGVVDQKDLEGQLVEYKLAFDGPEVSSKKVEYYRNSPQLLTYALCKYLGDQEANPKFSPPTGSVFLDVTSVGSWPMARPNGRWEKGKNKGQLRISRTDFFAPLADCQRFEFVYGRDQLENWRRCVVETIKDAIRVAKTGQWEHETNMREWTPPEGPMDGTIVHEIMSAPVVSRMRLLGEKFVKANWDKE